MSDLQTQYEYIYFDEIVAPGFKSRWYVRNNSSGQSLGSVGWYVPWGMYCFYPNQGIVLSGGCMIDIKNFMIQLVSKDTDQADLFGGGE